ncbi:hypothetical protein D3C78_756430 [compost metagenome]
MLNPAPQLLSKARGFALGRRGGGHRCRFTPAADQCPIGNCLVTLQQRPILLVLQVGSEAQGFGQVLWDGEGRRGRAEVAPHKLALNVPCQVIGQALDQHQVARFGQQDPLRSPGRECLCQRLRPNFGRSHLEEVFDLNEANPVVAEPLAGGALRSLVNLVHHGQRHHALPLVLDDGQLVATDRDGIHADSPCASATMQASARRRASTLAPPLRSTTSAMRSCSSSSASTAPA